MTSSPFFIVKESPIHGRGIFASRDIPQGTRIAEYTGEHISKAEEERREKENDKHGTTYIFCLSDTESIDGAYGGNDSRFINHSCDPNCDIDITDGHIYFVTNHDIAKNEELFIDYAFDKYCPKEPCNCRASNCRGIINEI